MDENTGKFQYAGLKFLYDMELIDDPQLINNLKLNMFSVARSIQDADILASYNHRQILIWIDLNWFGRTFLKDRIEAAVTERVQQLLPRFRFRVTSDRKIFDLALDRVKNVLRGATHEKPNSEPAGSSTPASS